MRNEILSDDEEVLSRTTLSGVMTPDRKHVLITFGRSFLALNLARLMAAAGHRVTVVDSIPVTLSRLSNASDRFYKVPAPKFEPVEYCRAVAKICAEDGVDIVIPLHEETAILAMLADIFPPTTELFTSDFGTIDSLHNKFEFQQLLTKNGIEALPYAKFENAADVAAASFTSPFALKRVYSRGSQKVHKVFPGEDLSWLEFEAGNPWFAQGWAEGDNYCTYSVCRDGKVYAHATYPVGYAIDGSSCLRFQSVEHQPILDWITDLVARLNYTGQIGFDFVDSPEHGLVCIEANPRSTSGIMMFDADAGVDRAFFGANESLITPHSDVDRMIGVGMMLYGWRRKSLDGKSIRQFVKDFRHSDDVIADREDLVPTVLLPVAYAGILRSCVKYRVSLAEGFMHDHEWDGLQISM